jgi:hypothetical protein
MTEWPRRRKDLLADKSVTHYGLLNQEALLSFKKAFRRALEYQFVNYQPAVGLV